MIRESTSLVFPRNNVGLFTRSRIPRRWRKFFGVTVKYFRLERRYRETFSPEVIPGTGISSEERVHTRHTHTHTPSSDLITSHGSSVLKHIIWASTALSFPSIFHLRLLSSVNSRTRLRVTGCFSMTWKRYFFFFRTTPCFFSDFIANGQTSLHLWIFLYFLWIFE